MDCSCLLLLLLTVPQMLTDMIRALLAGDLVEAAKGGVDGSPFSKNKLTEQRSRGLAKEVKEEPPFVVAQRNTEVEGNILMICKDPFLPDSAEKFACYKCQLIVRWEEKVKGLNAKLSVSQFIREAEEVLH